MVKKERSRLVLAQSDSANMAPPWVGGVASGLAAQYGLPVGAVRTSFAALSAVGGLGVIAYMVLWLRAPMATTSQTPHDQEATAAFRAPMREVGKRRDQEVTAGRLVVAGSIFLAVAGISALCGLGSGISGEAVFWFLFSLAGLMLVWLQAPRLSGKKNLRSIGFVILGTFMVVIGAMMVLSATNRIANPFWGLLAAIVVLGIAFVALAPLGIRVVRDLTSSREREVRETERADIAAHLHDSVLQTLTLIRGAAEDPARVRALALTQERELRSWLYTGHVAPENSAAEALNNQAVEVESTYGVPIEVVTVGDMWPGPRQLAAIAAATEAMTNASRHGEPPITVFQEARDGNLEIFVKDAGAGFDPRAVATDRHGLRNSIQGRVARVGGTVEIRFLPASDGGNDPSGPRYAGTEIRILLPHNSDNRKGDSRQAASSTPATPEARRPTFKREPRGSADEFSAQKGKA